MSMTKSTGVRVGVVPIAVLAFFAAGCGSERPGTETPAGSPSRAAAVEPSRPGAPKRQVDFPCPGETSGPTPSASAGPTGPAGPPADHYAENHGFKDPIQLHGQRRCEGIAAVKRVKNALEPLRVRKSIDLESARRALASLGYPATGVEVTKVEPGVSFLINASPLCIEGKVNPHFVEADAFGGYPDGTGCEPPRGGH
ncbi:hypothetical protein [Streptomyces sp. NRRL F-4489]|uniref:hypothetical protein n=1 Tax=Streptomyces sp. NRRL F-4489 TaxID=1609095 RepID=UPI00099E78DD|nr:hypothetical protein [Streptomyces sp. NRRL F-4489]